MLARKNVKITLGIEEELMLIDRGSGAVVSDPKNAIFERANDGSTKIRGVKVADTDG